MTHRRTLGLSILIAVLILVPTRGLGGDIPEGISHPFTLFHLADLFGLCEGGEGFDPGMDFDLSNCIDGPDLFMLAANWRPSDGPRIFADSISNMSGLPGSQITLSGQGLDPDADTWIRFLLADGLPLDIPVVDFAETFATAAVPPLLDLTKGAFRSGTVDLRIIQKTAGGVFRYSNPIDGFEVLEMPTPGGDPGNLTLDFLNETLDFGEDIKGDLSGSFLDNPVLEAALDTQMVELQLLIGFIEIAMLNPFGNTKIGEINNVDIEIGEDELRQADQVILSLFTVLSQLPAKGPTACLAAEAGIAAQAYQTESNPNSDLIGSVLRAPRNSVLCGSAEAFNSAGLVVAGAGGVGLGLLALAGAPAAALALPAAALLYVGFTSAGGMVYIGGVLGQSTQGAAELVQRGRDRLEDLYLDIVRGQVLPEASGAVDDFIRAAADLQEAFDFATIIPRAPTRTPAPSTPTPLPTGNATATPTGEPMTEFWSGTFGGELIVKDPCGLDCTDGHWGLAGDIDVNITGLSQGVSPFGLDGGGSGRATVSQRPVGCLFDVPCPVFDQDFGFDFGPQGSLNGNQVTVPIVFEGDTYNFTLTKTGDSASGNATVQPDSDTTVNLSMTVSKQ